MKNFDLKDINQEAITGHWQVYRRVQNNDAKDYFSDIDILDLKKMCLGQLTEKLQKDNGRFFEKRN